MNIVKIINKKKSNIELSKEEIDYFIKGLCNQSIEMYQASALLMAIYFNGMTDQEIINLTKSMINSGDVIDLKNIKNKTVDKHSTGGVGDKTSLVLAPILATFNLSVAKMSGRGLGHTGGTLDKLESITGFNIFLTDKEFIKQVNDINIAIIGQTKKLVPADKILYSLRDVTATVDSTALIASSIMSKKIASGAKFIMLDVKYGSGAFMKTKSDALLLAQKLVMIGKGLGVDTHACISSMQQPLGYQIGNANEIQEVITTLNGSGPQDLTDLCIRLASKILVEEKIFMSEQDAKIEITKRLNSGICYEKFREFVMAQGGDIDNFRHSYEKSYDLKLNAKGYLKEINAVKIGIAQMLLGGGRKIADQEIDHNVGIKIYHKVSDFVDNEVVATLYYNDKNTLEQALEELKDAFLVSDEKVDKIKVVEQFIN